MTNEERQEALRLIRRFLPNPTGTIAGLGRANPHVALDALAADLEAAERERDELRAIGHRMSEQVDKLAEDRIARNRDLAIARGERDELRKQANTLFQDLSDTSHNLAIAREALDRAYSDNRNEGMEGK